MGVNRVKPLVIIINYFGHNNNLARVLGLSQIIYRAKIIIKILRISISKIKVNPKSKL